MPMPKGRYTRLVRRDSDGAILEVGNIDKPRPRCKHCKFPIVYAPPVGRDGYVKEWRHANTFKVNCHKKNTIATYVGPPIE